MNAAGQIFKVLNNICNVSFQMNRVTLKSNLRLCSVSAKVSGDCENLVVTHNDVVEHFPLVWLRDNCTCPKCFHKSSQSRIINWTNFNVDVRTKSVQTGNGGRIDIKWDDDHVSAYALDWLRSRSFSRQARQKYLKDFYIPPKKTWSKAEFCSVMNVYEYQDVMTKAEKFRDWLMDLAVYGVVLIKNAPTHPSECRKLLEKIAFIRKTHYGEDFHVVAKEGTNNVAYLSNPLQLHTDLPYYDYKPGVNLLHCIVQTKNKGGENLLTDGFYVAENLRRENKQVFDMLSKTEVDWSDIGAEHEFKFHKIHRAPVIGLDAHDNIRSIRHSIPQRDSHFTVNLSDVKPWYKALKAFVVELYENAAEFKTEPGHILAFDNTRLVHGRVGYEDNNAVKRFLVGHYIDWDEIYSRIRVLRAELEK